jgi:hypothetical protein
VAEIASLEIADPPELWTRLGFAVDAGMTWSSGTCLRLGAPGLGVVAWSLRGVHALTEVPTSDSTVPPVPPEPHHPNGVIALDHVVISTPHIERTVAAFGAAGIPLRRTRQAGTPAEPRTQAFFKLGDTVIEIVGSPTSHSPGPARFWGLTFTVADLEATTAFMGQQLRPSKVAVQRGRRIATLDRAVGSSVPMAFMSPKPQ